MERGTSSSLERRRGAPTAAEAALADVLASVLRVARVPLESHFFTDLGADSMVMAHFCARVRKRDDLPSASMRDVYRHPTIRSLAAALAANAPASAPALTVRAATAMHTREMVACGALQALCFLGYAYVAVATSVESYDWVVAGAGVLALYLRLVACTAAVFLLASALPVVAKWLLVGRWKPGELRIWSLAYLRFWIVKTLVRSSPAARFFVGTPLYVLYLRALGARIGPGVVIFSRRVPVCTDLITIGAGSVIRKEALFSGYRAEAGRIEIGAVTLGRDTLVGERSVLDLGTAMGDGAQLGHASTLASGQEVPAGARWHGSPAQPTTVDYRRVAPLPGSTRRRATFAALAAAGVLLVALPLVSGILSLAAEAASWLTAPLAADGTPARLAFTALVLSALLFAGLALGGLVLAVVAARLLGRLLQPDRTYPLYGLHDAMHRTIARIGRIKFFTYLFGDSSYIVHYLQWLGCRLSPMVQTGSNFGIEVTPASPRWCRVGSGTMVADGLALMNDEVSATSFRLARAALGKDTFVGNDVTVPADGRVGDNCLLATKVMVPLDGEVRSGVGLLGSPCFEIPRSVERDSRFDHRRTGDELARGLAAKDRFNRRTIGVFLLTRWLGVFLVVLLSLAAFEAYPAASAVATLCSAFSLIGEALYLVLVERGLEALRPLAPITCSIYDPGFWSHERLWKVHPIHLLHAFDGTPWKNLLWRLLGVRLGRRVFDDGVHISEPTLTTIGDECVLNYRSKIQCHSQEDGTFKADRSALGAGCTIGVGALVHYGVVLGAGAVLDANAFLMKGEEVPTRARWGGNPARELGPEAGRA
jgi:non-ribosomal peptide synthetase-like protein